MIAFTPTAEQDRCVDLFGTGRDLAVQAGAGCAKTTTCDLMARSTRRAGRYLVFNRAAANDAAAMLPMNVQASTIHSLAFRTVGHRFGHRLNEGRVQSWKLAKLLGVDPVVVTVDDRSKLLQPATLASWTMRALKVFCQSGDPEPSWRHFPYLDGIDDHPEPGVKGRRNNRALAKEMEAHLVAAWVDWQDPAGRLPYGHEGYLKAWSLSEPKVNADFLMVDEFQDLAPVTLRVVEYNQAHGVQVVAVGDLNQAIYGFTGAVDGFARLDFSETGWLTLSHRFGPPVAEVANLILNSLAAELRLEGTSAVTSAVEDVAEPAAILCRTNSGAVHTVLRLRKDGKRPHLVGGAAEVVRFARAVADLQEGRTTYHPELACFDSWNQVLDYVDQDPQGDELRLMVKLVTEYGVQIIVDALDGLPAEDNADCVVSTAHVSKGRAWPTVRLAGDFQEANGDRDSAAENRLLYVAVTRARQVLDVSSCGPLQKLLGKAS